MIFLLIIFLKVSVAGRLLTGLGWAPLVLLQIADCGRAGSEPCSIGASLLPGGCGHGHFGKG